MLKDTYRNSRFIYWVICENETSDVGKFDDNNTDHLDKNKTKKNVTNDTT